MKLARRLASEDTVAYFTMEPGDEPLTPNTVVRIGYDMTSTKPFAHSELLWLLEPTADDGWIVRRGYLQTDARTHDEGTPA